MLRRGPRKTWHEMTRQEIIASLSVFTVIGILIVAGFTRILVVAPKLNVMAVVPVAGVLFILVAVGVSCIQAFRELRRRKPSCLGDK